MRDYLDYDYKEKHKKDFKFVETITEYTYIGG